MRPLRAIVCTVCVCTAVASASVARVAHAQSPAAGAAAPGKEVAKRLFEEGAELEKKGDYAGALAKYKEAEQITATPGLRFHKGYCLEMLGKYSAALEEYEAADKLALSTNRQDVHAAVTARLDPLRVRVPQMAIRLTTPVKDVEVHLDGAPVGASMLDGTVFRLDPGEHTVTARAPDYKPFTRKVQVPEGQTTTVDLNLDRTAPGPVVTDPAAQRPVTEPPREPRKDRSLTLPIATTAAAAVLAGVGVTMFVVASGAQSDAQTECLTKASCGDERSRVRTFDTLALGSFIAAAGFAVVAVVLWTSAGSSPSAGSAPRSGPRTRMVAAPSGLGLEGTFW